MDARKFNSKLRQTFKTLFIDKRTPHDDTLLEKLTTLLEKKLNDNTGEYEIIVESLNAVPWMKTLFENWKTIDSSVAAFGLNVIGIAISSNKLCENPVIKNSVVALRTCLQSLVQEFDGLPALLRFSLLKQLHKLMVAKTANVDFLPPIVLSDLLLNSLTDDSIFVARAAQDFLIYILMDMSKRVQLGAQESNSESCELIKIVDHLLTCAKGADTDSKAKRKAIVALRLLQDVCLRSPSTVPLLMSSSQLKSIVLEIIENTDDEDICLSCSHLLLLLIECQSKNILQEWLTVVDILIRNQQVICLAKFLTITGERWSNKNIKLSQIFKTILLRPLIQLSHWQPTQQLPWMKESCDNWNETLNILSADCKHLVLSKLISCIMANLPKLHGCFNNSEERFALLDLLLCILSDFDKYESYPVKMQNITIDSILGMLTNWGSHWFVELSAGDQDVLLNNSITILDKYVTPPSLMIKIMKTVQLLLKICHLHLASDWNVVIKRLNKIVQIRCHDVQWEVRDSAFEMLAEMTKLAKVQNHLQEWVKESGSLNISVIALDDTEGYIRASALQVFQNLPEIICEEQVIVDVDITVKLKPIEIIVQILLQDSEGITRRAAITTLLTCYKEDCILPTYMDHVYKSMVIASMDLDWEVKLTAIDFWERLLTNVFANETSEEDNFNSLNKTGFFDAATSLLEDEDVTVQHKMAHLIKRLKESCHLSISKCLSSASMPDTQSDKIVCENRGIKTPMSEQYDEQMEVAISEEQKMLAIESVLGTRDYVTVENVMVSSEDPHTSANWLRGDKVDLNELLAKHHHNRIPIALSEFVNWLDKLNVDALLLQTDLTTDLYNANPEALLDDILLDNYESDNEEEIAMDCY